LKLLELLKRTYTKTEAVGMITIIFGIGLCFDIIIHGFRFVLIFIPIALLLIGHNQRKKGQLIGTILIAIGAVIVTGIVLVSIAFQLVIVSLLIYYGYHLYTSKAHPQDLNLKTEPSSKSEKDFIKVEPFFKNMFFGEMRSLDDVYELDDINIQYGFGDVHLDLSYAMISEGETVILIRGLVGKVQLYVPYDVELCIHTSALIGKINLLDNKKNLFNATHKFQTRGYKTATRKIKVITSLLIGDIEVRNI